MLYLNRKGHESSCSNKAQANLEFLHPRSQATVSARERGNRKSETDLELNSRLSGIKAACSFLSLPRGTCREKRCFVFLCRSFLCLFSPEKRVISDTIKKLDETAHEFRRTTSVAIPTTD